MTRRRAIPPATGSNRHAASHQVRLPSLLAACLAVASTAAAVHAQTTPSLQLYGTLDIGVVHLDRIAGGQSRTHMPSITGGQMASRVGLRGKEDLGAGLSALFVLEAGFAPNDGTSLQSGRLFGRQSHLGLSGDWGALAFGRQYLMSYYALPDVDFIGPAVFGLGSLNAYIPNARADNTVTYRVKLGGWTLGAAYSRGRDALPPSLCGSEQGVGNCGAYSAIVRYDAATWGVALAHDRLKGGAGSGFFGQPAGLAVVQGGRDEHTFLTGHAKFGDTRVGLGWIHRRLKAQPRNFRSDQVFASFRQSVTAALSIDGLYTYLHVNRRQSDAQLLSLRLNYVLSPRTALYAMAGRVVNEDAVGYSVSGGTTPPPSPGLGKSQTGLIIGMSHRF